MTRIRDRAAADSGGETAETLRIDKWLWYARLSKTRALAARLCGSGAVVLGGAPTRKANHAIRRGDVLRVPRGGYIHTIRVLALGSRRGPAAEARLLYAEEAPPEPLSAREAAWLPLLAENDEGGPEAGSERD
jgi:ribosome-associated heat shock protein Hsp15